MIVAKVGGSLYDDPRLSPAMRQWVAEQPETVLLVPGGGEFADAVRKLDAIHGLGEEAAHWMAIASLSAAGEFLRRLVPDVEVFDVPAFCLADCELPHTWAVTSDSLALAAAIHLNASKLVLLKSADMPSGLSWAEAAAAGFVDAHFPTLAVGATLPIEAVNFRRWAEFRFPAGGR